MNHVLDFDRTFSDERLISELSIFTPQALESQVKKFSSFSKIYSFASENLAGYCPSLPFEKSSVLAVGASFDHCINAYLLGAEEVTAFDVNILAGLFSNLKLAGIEKMQFDKFRKFFLRGDGKNLETFDYKLYGELSNELTLPAKLFFDSMYSQHSNDGFLLRNSQIFNTAYDFDFLKIKSNLYMQSAEAFEKARRMLEGKKTEWIHSSLASLPAKTAKKFDIILLSNIADYAKSAYAQENYLETFCRNEIEPLKALLNKNGIIAAAYVYDARTKFENGDFYRTDIDNPSKRRLAFQLQGMNYDELYFDSVMPDKKDAVVLLQRR